MSSQPSISKSGDPSSSEAIPLTTLSEDSDSDNEETPRATPGPSSSNPKPRGGDEPLSPLSPIVNLKDHLKHRLTLFGDHLTNPFDADDIDETTSEYELLLDPNLPANYRERHQPLPRASIDSLHSPTHRRKPVSAQDGEDDETEDILPEEVENSPYPEVRAAVSPFDDPSLPCNTVRAWVIGLSLIFLGASMNTLFSLRSPSISLGALIAQVIAWPLGHGWARWVPDVEVSVPFFSQRHGKIKLNPGEFNVKEHAIIVVMASVSFGVAYATDIILAQKVFYKQDFGLMWQLLLTISTQSLGYGIAGMMRRFLGKRLAVKQERS